jgi:hypothetical protein
MLRKLGISLVASLLTACVGTDGFGRRPAASPPPPSSEAVQAARISAYIATLQRLVQGSPAEQAEVLAALRAGYDSTPEGQSLLHYALALAAPSHPGRNPELAQQLLRQSLARPELLSMSERALGVVELQRVDAELKLAAENQRLVGEPQTDRDRQRAAANAAAARRLQAEIDENAKLRKALEEARAKLDAIAAIESNISDRPPSTEGRTP